MKTPALISARDSRNAANSPSGERARAPGNVLNAPFVVNQRRTLHGMFGGALAETRAAPASQAPIQRKPPKPGDFKTGSASKNKKLNEFMKNQRWEIGFRKLSKVKPGTFDPSRENDQIIPLQKAHIEEGIPLNHSIEGIAISRNADFVLDVLRSGLNKAVVIVAIPPLFGIDLELEYLKWYRETRPDELRPNKHFPEEYEKNIENRLSMEVTLQRVPTGCIYAWIERYQESKNGETVLSMWRTRSGPALTLPRLTLRTAIRN